jgi:hypothetical protein
VFRIRTVRFVCFLASRIRIRKSEVWIQTLYHQAEIVRKTLIPTVLRLLYDFFIFEKWCKCTLALKSKNKKNQRKKIPSGVLKDTDKIAGSGSGSQVRIRIRTKNVTDPQHCTDLQIDFFASNFYEAWSFLVLKKLGGMGSDLDADPGFWSASN